MLEYFGHVAMSLFGKHIKHAKLYSTQLFPFLTDLEPTPLQGTPWKWPSSWSVKVTPWELLLASLMAWDVMTLGLSSLPASHGNATTCVPVKAVLQDF